MILTHLLLTGLLTGAGGNAPVITPGVSIASTTDANSYTTGAFTPAAGDLLVVMFAVATPPNQPVSVLGSDGIIFVQAAISGTNRFVYIADRLANAVSQTVTIDFGAAGATALCGSVERVSGMTRVGLDARRQFDDDNGGSATVPGVDLPAVALSSNPILVMCGNGSNPAALTPPVNWTESFDVGVGTPTTGYESASRANGFTGQAIDWAAASATAWRAIGIELDTSAAPGSPPTGPGGGVCSIIRRRRR